MTDLRIKGKQIADKAIDGSKIELKSGESLMAQDPSQNNVPVELLKIGPDGKVLSKSQEIAFAFEVDAEELARQQADIALQAQIASLDTQIDAIQDSGGTVSAEANIRAAADAAFDTRISTLENPEISLTSSATAATLFTATGRSFTAHISVFANSKAEVFHIMGIYNGVKWFSGQASAGETTDVSFSVSTTGAVQFSDPAAQSKTIKYVLTKTSL